MKSANMVLQEAIFNAVSKRAADTLREELELLGAVKIKEVDEAQDRVMKVVRRLEEEGEVSLDSGGDNVLA
jgi:flagellar motor switch protein FliG